MYENNVRKTQIFGIEWKENSELKASDLLNIYYKNQNNRTIILFVEKFYFIQSIELHHLNPMIVL